ncbi:anti-sigma factor domain-containing protein [uncultured Hymenobacter sp.]|uniref:anti-sigma factor n=1 Tax=uncultured Hymenobacter sp. TaxID=170016 RepID=UPI0035C9F7AE
MEKVTAYIESGVLEQYVLGELSAAERAAVEAEAQREFAVRQALDELRAGLELYTQAHAQTPPAGLRERVLERALRQTRDQGVPAPAAPDDANDTTSPLRVSARQEANGAPSVPTPPLAATGGETPRRPLYPATPAAETATRPPNWAIAASVALLLSLAGNAVLYSRWQQSDAALVAVQQEQASFAATSQATNQQLAETRQEVAVLRDERFRVVALAGTKAAPTARARVFYNAATQAVFVDVRRLPVLPADKQYQLWALDKGQPVDAGILATATATGAGMQQMKNVTRAQAFAMTVEPAGGSPTPTLSTMTVLGELKAGES